MTNDATPVAAIDLGSNTARLLIAVPGDQGPKRLLTRQLTTRLGQGLTPGRPLSEEAAERTFRVLADYRRDIESHGASRVLLAATMAVRESADGRDYLSRIERELGFETAVLSGEEEARLTAAGVTTILRPVPRLGVVFDLGGRSTEFIRLAGGRAEEVASLNLGVVALTEAYIHHDPPQNSEVEALRQAAAAVLTEGLAGVFREAAANRRMVLVGTAGTATTLAAMGLEMTEYDPERIDNHTLHRRRLADMFNETSRLTIRELARLPGLPEDRADVMVAGAAAVLKIMDFFSAESFIVSDKGLLEGVWLAAAGIRSIR